MKIVLIHPQIPQNTGNIARTCVTTGTKLSLIKPLGFEITDRQLKRAGLDYWKFLDFEVCDGFSSDEETENLFFFSSKATKNYSEASFSMNSVLIFGSETEGIPSVYWDKFPDRFFKIPMISGPRCLNLSSAAAIVVFEAWRQNKFKGSS
jgi:tRNA (cytidine/uridine-2'-O-)-methyltransferase